MEINEEQKNKILKIRQLLKKNAPYVYKKFVYKKICEKNKKTKIIEQKKVFKTI